MWLSSNVQEIVDPTVICKITLSWWILKKLRLQPNSGLNCLWDTLHVTLWCPLMRISHSLLCLTVLTVVLIFSSLAHIYTKRLLTTFEFNVGVGVNVRLALSLDWYPQGNDGGDNYSSGSHLGALRVIQQVEFTSSRFLSANGRVFAENEREKSCWSTHQFLWTLK